jgi:hypothetical protein
MVQSTLCPTSGSGDRANLRINVIKALLPYLECFHAQPQDQGVEVLLPHPAMRMSIEVQLLDLDLILVCARLDEPLTLLADNPNWGWCPHHSSPRGSKLDPKHVEPPPYPNSAKYSIHQPQDQWNRGIPTSPAQPQDHGSRYCYLTL